MNGSMVSNLSVHLEDLKTLERAQEGGPKSLYKYGRFLTCPFPRQKRRSVVKSTF